MIGVSVNGVIGVNGAGVLRRFTQLHAGRAIAITNTTITL
jgi:hypothetical protein